jgi:hypothetical protein
MESNNLRAWVEHQTALLDPPDAWQPDSGRGFERFRALVDAPPPRSNRTRWLVWAAAAALIAAVIVGLPAGRAAAQQVWEILTVRRVAFVWVKPWPAGVPSPQVKLVGTPIPPLPAPDVDVARARVGYSPRMPHAGVLSSTPSIYTTFSLSAGTTVKVADLEQALRGAGIADVSVPAAWDGAQLVLHTSSVVMAQWPEVVLAQSLPLTLTAPPGFDFPAFSAIVLRIVGLNPDDARRLAERMGITPAWIAPMVEDMHAFGTMEEITVKSSPATLLEERTSNGAAGRISIFWSVPDRVYLLSGTLSRELMIAFASAVD